MTGNIFRTKAATLFDVVKAGNLVACEEFLETLGSTEVCNLDDKGYTPVHWVCLGGHTSLLYCFIKHDLPINIPGKNNIGACPIHWACVNGHIAVVDMLLQNGVPVDTCDKKGCSPLIVACQYGHSVLAGYLMGQSARLSLTDKDGDNALHWAAFKGNIDCMRLLIYSGFSPYQKDSYGQTPLHLASINGSLDTVKELCKLDGVEIDVKDKNGRTPMELAKCRGHEEIIFFLELEHNRRKNLVSKIFSRGNSSENSIGPLLIFIFGAIGYGYPMYILWVAPATWRAMTTLHITFLLSNFAMWFCLFRAHSVNPGFLPRDTDAYHYAVKQVAHYSSWKNNEKNPLEHLCHTCRLVKPMRSKHCKFCQSCVLNFDHHCPYIYNCVGLNNRVWFFFFLCTTTYNLNLATYWSWELWNLEGQYWLNIINFGMAVLFSLLCCTLVIGMVYGIVCNLTTNETYNYKRYDYLKDENGKFHNPFHRGFFGNVREFFHCLPASKQAAISIRNLRTV